jgi:hypothetical protein
MQANVLERLPVFTAITKVPGCGSLFPAHDVEQERNRLLTCDCESKFLVSALHDIRFIGSLT